ncbi:hypothetical protein, partial [Aquidulcibacter sp.]|uniref:hypothetical protein n=1 Tax=Aquidulcibacter sp. TaxID=2052990 RepID=UPI0028A84394
FWMERLAEAYRSNRNIADLAEELGVSRLAFYSALRDPFYAMRNMTFLPTEEDMGLIDIPILSSTGHYDSTHAGTLYHFMQHERFGSPQARGKHHLVMTPWHNSGMEGTS